MIKISVIYIGIVVILSAFIAGVPFVLWSDDTAEQVEKVANIPLGQIIRPVSGGASAQTADGSAATPQPGTPMPAGLEEARAAILQDLSFTAGAAAPTQAQPAPTQPESPAVLAQSAPDSTTPAPAAADSAAQDGIAAAVAAAVESATRPVDPAQAPDVSPRPKANPAATGAGNPAASGGDDLQAMTGLALDGLRQLRGKTLDSLEYLVPKALAEGADDTYIQALQSEAAR